MGSRVPSKSNRMVFFFIGSPFFLPPWGGRTGPNRAKRDFTQEETAPLQRAASIYYALNFRLSATAISSQRLL